MENTLTIEEWKAEQQLFEHKRTVPVYHLLPVRKGRKGGFFCEQAKQKVTWPGSQLNMHFSSQCKPRWKIELDGEFDPGSG